MSSTTEQIKDRLAIDDVVSSYIRLDRAGKNLRARCPFHNEKTPSFYVSPERGSYYCFGCGRKGDIFSFVQEFEGLDFVGALKVLAERAGVPITFNKQAADAYGRVFAALEMAADFFEGQLAKQMSAQKYLAERGLSKETITRFRIGYIADTWHALEEYARTKGFTHNELLQAGLVKKNDRGNVYDTFRGRIMFPVFDSSGRVVAFSGRAFETESEAKYLNSPETVVFKKSRTLYGFGKAKNVIRKHDFSILVEGNIDVMLSHQVGYTNTVAPLGTAVTPAQLALLRRLSDKLVLALDADSAGIASAGRTAALGLALGFDVKVAALPVDTDPADLISSDADGWKTCIKTSQHIVDFMLAMLKKKHSNERDFELAVRRDVVPFVARIENKIDQAHFVKRVAETLSITENAVYEEVAKVPADDGTATRAHDTVGTEVEETETEQESREDGIVRQLRALIAWQEHKHAPKAKEIATRLCNMLAISSLDELAGSGETEDVLLFEAEHTFEGVENIDAMIEELFVGLTEERTRRHMSKLLTDLKRAEQAHDTTRAATLLEEFHKEARKLEDIRMGK